MSFDLELARRMRAGAGHRGEVCPNLPQSIGIHAISHNDVLEGVLFETSPHNSVTGKILHYQLPRALIGSRMGTPKKRQTYDAPAQLCRSKIVLNVRL